MHGDPWMREKIQKVIESGLVSRPQLQRLPEGIPIHAAICALHLPSGCLPPLSGAPRRVASGCSFDATGAEFLALAEATERYSLQFSHDRPRRLIPIETLVGKDESCSIDDLTIGAPTTNGSVNSKGCAAGATMEEAVLRAALEAYEHVVLRGFYEGNLEANLITGDCQELSDLRTWLTSQYRALSHCVYQSSSGLTTVRSCCSDFDGGRPTFGSSASFSLEEAIVASSLEAVFHWRNMVAMENQGTKIGSGNSDEAHAVKLYRGVYTNKHTEILGTIGIQEIQKNQVTASQTISNSMYEALDELCRLSRQRVRVFNMTKDEISIPVVRILIG